MNASAGRAPLRAATGLFVLATLLGGPAGGHGGGHGGETDHALLDRVDFEQRIGARLPGDTRFADADGRVHDIADLAADRPLALIMAWLDCPDLCPILLGETARAAATLPFSREQFRVAIVSIEPDDAPEDAARVRERLRRRHGDAVANWRFLTGDEAAIDRLADAIGFEYAYDAEARQYAHPAGVVIAAPGGRIGRYLFGLRPDPRDLKLALVEAGEGRVGSATEQALLRCFRFDPETGQYNVAVLSLLRWAGGGFALAVAGAILWLRRRERARE